MRRHELYLQHFITIRAQIFEGRWDWVIRLKCNIVHYNNRDSRNRVIDEENETPWLKMPKYRIRRRRLLFIKHYMMIYIVNRRPRSSCQISHTAMMPFVTIFYKPPADKVRYTEMLLRNIQSCIFVKKVKRPSIIGLLLPLTRYHFAGDAHDMLLRHTPYIGHDDFCQMPAWAQEDTSFPLAMIIMNSDMTRVPLQRNLQYRAWLTRSDFISPLILVTFSFCFHACCQYSSCMTPYAMRLKYCLYNFIFVLWHALFQEERADYSFLLI